MTPPGRSSVDLRDRIEIETPEHVVLRYEVAGLGSRGLAAVLDHAILFIVLFAIDSISAFSTLLGAHWTEPLWLVTSFLIFWGYFSIFEGAWNGQTPGKRALGIRVVRSDGRSAGWSTVLVRNLLRVIDFLPPPYLGGVCFLFFHPRSRRVGDLAADTLVVRDHLEQAAPVAEQVSAAAAPVPGLLAAQLTPEEYRVVEDFLARSGRLDDEARARLAGTLATRLGDRFPSRPRDPEVFLQRVYAEERARRAEGRGGTAGEMAAMRLAARQRPRWETFAQLADRATKRGLDSLQAAELPDFAARYREVAADLARLRTYAAPPALLARVERIASAGHNAFYRSEEARWHRVGPMILREFPAAVVRARWSVLLAVALLVGSGAAGYHTLRTTPDIAEEVLPQTLLERAAAAGSRTAAGLTYAEVEPEQRASMAAFLMTHNIGVALMCFAGGVLFGIGSLYFLGVNGTSLGATLGHFVNVGAGGYLLSFIVGHGILELFAICVATAAGLRLGLALWVPGDRPRAEALPRAAKLSLRLLGASATLLVVAGMIEGLASASGASLTYRLAVSSASAVFLVLYLINGARWASTLDAP